MKKTVSASRSARLVALLTIPAVLPAATFTWDGGAGDGLWTSASNWTGDMAPPSDGTADIVFTGTPADNPTQLGGDFAARTVTINLPGGNNTISGGVLTLVGTGNVDTHAFLSRNGGTINSQIKFDASGAGGFIQVASGGTLTLNGGVDLNGKGVRFAASQGLTLNLNGVIGSSAAHGTNAVVYRGTGTMNVNALNTYSHGTSILEGTVVISQNARDNEAGAFGNNAQVVNLGSNGLAGNVQLFTGAAVEVGKTIIVLTNGSSNAAKTYQIGGNTAHTSTFSGDILLGSPNAVGQGVELTAAAGGRVNFGGIKRRGNTTNDGDTVTKVGAGVVALTGAGAAYTYEGDTIVKEGTLLVNGVLQAGALSYDDTVEVQSGAILGGFGTIGRATTFRGGAILSPGDVDASFVSQAGKLSFTNNVLFENGALLEFDLGAPGAGDTVSVTGNLTLAGTLNINALAGFGVGSHTLFSYTGVFLNSGLALGDTPAGYNYALGFSADSVVLNVTAIPEPGTFALAAGALALAGAAVRRRRSVKQDPAAL